MLFIGDFWYYLASLWYQLTELSMYGLVKYLWFCLFLDIPRYLIPDLIVFVRALFAKGPKPSAEEELPLVSVLIPARNEEETVGYTIRSLLENNYPRLDIIVIDDGSEDRTFEVCQGFARKGLIRVLRKHQRGGKASCLNLGLGAAKGEFIVSVDSDTTFDRDAIRNILKPFHDPKVGAVSGNIKVRNRDHNLLTKLQTCEYLIGISIGRRWLAAVNLLTVVSGAFGCYHREVLEDNGAWDPGIGDDSNVTLKTRKLGLKVAFAHDAIAMTNVPTTLRRLFRQRRRWNKSFIRNRFRKHKNILNPLVFPLVNPLALAQGLVFRVLLALGFFVFLAYNLIYHLSLLDLIFVLVIIAYSILNFVSLSIGAFLSERRDEDWKLIFYAPLMVPYRLWVRFVRVVAYIQEFFRIGYEEAFYPARVWKEAPRW